MRNTDSREDCSRALALLVLIGASPVMAVGHDMHCYKSNAWGGEQARVGAPVTRRMASARVVRHQQRTTRGAERDADRTAIGMAAFVVPARGSPNRISRDGTGGAAVLERHDHHLVAAQRAAIRQEPCWPIAMPSGNPGSGASQRHAKAERAV